MTDEEKKTLSVKVSKYAQSEFSYQKTVDEWDSTLSELIENWNISIFKKKKDLSQNF